MNETDSPAVAAVVAAAGFSRRMGRFKQLLPWDQSTVIVAVVNNLCAAGADPVLAVVGHRGDEVTAVLSKTSACIVRNPNYATNEMLSSYQAGVREMLGWPAAMQPSGTLLALGDQPHIPVDVIQRIVDKAGKRPGSIVVPSHEMRRGHPIYLPQRLWSQLLALGPDETLRDLLNRYARAIVYVNVETDAIRRDMDTPGQYEARRREALKK